MQRKKALPGSEQYIKTNHRRRIWQKIVRTLGCVVVFCTTYALILPAITMEHAATCEMEEHAHTESCYIQPTESEAAVLSCSPENLSVHNHAAECFDAEGVNLCGQADYVAHTHDAFCVDAEGNLVCSFPEIGKHVHAESCYELTGHIHGEECYTLEQGALICQEAEGHVHDDSCQGGTELVCELAESVGHTHEEACYETGVACGLEEENAHEHDENCVETLLNCTLGEDAEHVHGEECYENVEKCNSVAENAHTHDDNCYKTVQTCGLAEEAGHAHGDACYVTVEPCAEDASEPHVHGEACFEWNQALTCELEESEEASALICTEPVAEEHIHGEACMTSVVSDVEPSLTCTLEESEEHTHDFLCYGTWELTCELEEHTHELACFSDPEADVETEEVWKRTLPNKLTGVYVDDLLATADSQLGYTESERNYIVLEDGETMKGYTRYGAWYGDPYGDWDGMFVSFCLYYSGANELEALKDFPLESDPAQWVKKLTEDELFRKAEDGTPEPGDLIFFNNMEDEYNEADHVGIVAEVGDTTIKVYEGDIDNQVRRNTYDLGSSAVVGYGILPEVSGNTPADAAETTAAAETTEATEATEAVVVADNIFTYSDDTVQVEVGLPEDSAVPADAVLKVAPIVSGDENYDALVEKAESAVDGTVSNILFYDISFYDANGDYHPVSDTAKVSLRFVEPVVDTNANVQVLHFADNTAAPEVIEEVTVEEKEVVIETIIKEAPEETVAAETEPVAVTFSLRRSDGNAAETEPAAEPVVETISEVRTVVEFHTNGFSTFAVVEYETAKFVTTVVNGADRENLNGGTFVITTLNTFDDPATHYALTSDDVTIHEEYGGNYNQHERLKAAAADRADGIVTTSANQNVLWDFTAVDGKVNTYYIKSRATGEYLYIAGNRTVLTTPTANEIVVELPGDGNEVKFIGNDAVLRYENANIQEGIEVFCTWGNSDEAKNRFVLSKYTDNSVDDDVVLGDTLGLDGNNYYISAVNFNDGDANSAPLALSSAPNAAGNQLHSAIGDYAAAVWHFEAVDDNSGAYYISTEVDGATKYLHIGPDPNLTLVDAPQAITVVNATETAELAVQDAICLIANGVALNLNGNHFNSEYFCSWGSGTGDSGNHLILTEVDLHPLDGQRFIIAGIDYNGNGLNPVMTSNAVEEGIDDQGMKKPGLQHITPTAIDLDNNTVTVNNQDDSEIWLFEAAEQAGWYYIKSAESNEYLYLQNNSLTTREERQAIELVYEGTTAYLRVAAADDGGYVYLNLCKNQYNSDFTGYQVAAGVDNNGNHLALIPVAGVHKTPVTDIGNKTFVVTNVNLNQDGNENVWLEAVKALSSDDAPDNAARRAAKTVTATYNENKDTVISITADQTDDLHWVFEPANAAQGQYYIRSVKTGGYLRLDNGNGSLYADGTAETRSTFTVEQVHGLAQAGRTQIINDIVCISSNGRYLNLQSNTPESTEFWGYNGGGEADPGNHFVLTEYNENPLVTNLDGKVTLIVGVNYAGTGEPPALSADVVTDYATALGGKTGFIGQDTDGIVANNSGVIDNHATFNNIAWQFHAADEPGTYYIEAVDGNLEAAKQYLHISEAGLTLSQEKQAIEVVKATSTTAGDMTEVVCLRVWDGDEYWYVNLYNNNQNSNFTSYAGGDTSERGNHLAIVELDQTVHADFYDLLEMIDKLPLTEEFKVEAENLDQDGYLMDYNANEGAPEDLLAAGKAEFKAAADYRQQMRENAIAAKAAYDALTEKERIFLGEERIDKLINELEWLWRKNPETVTPIGLNATVKVFNYGPGINNEGLANADITSGKGYNFFHHRDYGGIDPNVSSVDGRGVWHYENGNTPAGYTPVTTSNNMVNQLGEDGYPVIDGANGGSMAYLFNGTHQVGAAMENGGGLFQQDSNGYYYYYSDHNAAYFDQGENKFILYDTVVRPIYQGAAGANGANGDAQANFLPFNPVIDNIIYDDPSVADTITSEFDGHTSNTAYINAPTDLWFGMTIEFDFYMPKDGKVNGQDMIFDFHGDDDVLVYIDNELVLDIGGIHPAQDGAINFATGAVTDPSGDTAGTLAEIFANRDDIAKNGDTFGDYTKHTLKFFYMERGGNISFCGIKFNLILLPENSLTVAKAVETTDGTPVNDELYYTFRVIEATDSNGNGSLDPFFYDTTFTIEEEGQPDGMGYIDLDGCFSLKAGQKAVFEKLAQNRNPDISASAFIVQELIPGKLAGQYEAVKIGTGVVTADEETFYTYTTYSSGSMEIEGAPQHVVPFVNVIESVSSVLKVTKTADTNAGFGDREFPIYIEIGDEQITRAAVDPEAGPAYARAVSLIKLSVGTTYTVTAADGGTVPDTDDTPDTWEVETAGLIYLKVGQTATITGLPAGTNFFVYEEVVEGGHYMAQYSGTTMTGTISSNASGVTGELGVEDTAAVTVKNLPYDFAMNLHISKQVIGYSDQDSFTFDIEYGNWNSEKKEWVRWDDAPNAIVNVTGDGIYWGTSVIGFDSTANGTYEYKITERETAGNYIFDETVYIAFITVENREAVMTRLVKVINNELVDVQKVTDRQGREEFPIAFTNYATYATVSKTVKGPNKAGQFEFTAVVEYASDITYNWPASTDYTVGETVVDGTVKKTTITFNLEDAESVSFPMPVNATLTVKETDCPGYHTSYEIDDDGPQAGRVAEAAVETGVVRIAFTNETGYELPQTGGTGTYLYTMGGLLIMMAAAILLYYQRKRGKEELASS